MSPQEGTRRCRGRPAATASPARSANARAKRAAERRRAILAAALAEFSDRGFAATRLDDVARRANVAKGTIYLYFADKETLFQELIRAELSPVLGALEGAALNDAPLRRAIEQLFEVFVREVYGSRRKDVIRLILTEGPRFPKLAEFYYREVLSRALKAVRGLARRALERGELRNDALARFPQLIAGPLVMAILWQSLFDRFEPLDVRALLRAHIDLVFFADGRSP